MIKNIVFNNNQSTTATTADDDIDKKELSMFDHIIQRDSTFKLYNKSTTSSSMVMVDYEVELIVYINDFSSTNISYYKTCLTQLLLTHLKTSNTSNKVKAVDNDDDVTLFILEKEINESSVSFILNNIRINFVITGYYHGTDPIRYEDPSTRYFLPTLFGAQDAYIKEHAGPLELEVIFGFKKWFKSQNWYKYNTSLMVEPSSYVIELIVLHTSSDWLSEPPQMESIPINDENRLNLFERVLDVFLNLSEKQIHFGLWSDNDKTGNDNDNDNDKNNENANENGNENANKNGNENENENENENDKNKRKKKRKNRKMPKPLLVDPVNPANNLFRGMNISALTYLINLWVMTNNTKNITNDQMDENQPLYTCEECSKKFLSESGLKDHLLDTKHTSSPASFIKLTHQKESKIGDKEEGEQTKIKEEKDNEDENDKDKEVSDEVSKYLNEVNPKLENNNENDEEAEDDEDEEDDADDDDEDDDEEDDEEDEDDDDNEDDEEDDEEDEDDDTKNIKEENVSQKESKLIDDVKEVNIIEEEESKEENKGS
eukprot:CAMPEP_0114356740 /NCGR_PEP_ID=MMETSP0101-20121206/21163_1 /TAXON_ID=38822 ORGANISM="Pteridomonas danica, Strain PT" /NCGR_SAMPLE_ID=MMETSP0101 /ASSEMBLY_ACC=CAM_ASM_000211 /LENGTH=544 /DNA_ID=CAMNT_0001499273 /DNA_START=340 /DNA_END=1974 /DNA_ORIENTATION=+